MTGGLSDDKLADLRVAHLNIVQGIISRISGFSANAKNFCITITAALVAVMFDKELPELAWAGLAVIVVFLFIDSYYLGLERQYRNLYKDICAAPLACAADLGISVKPLGPAGILSPAKSISVWPFYAALLAGMIYFGYCSGHGKQRPRPSELDRSIVIPEQQFHADTATNGAERASNVAERPVQGNTAAAESNGSAQSVREPHP